MGKILFQENQKFNQYWVSIPLAIVGLINISVFIYGFIQQIIKGIPWGSSPMSDLTLVFVFALVIFIWASIFLLFYLANLKTKITDIGIQISFPPFFSNPKSFTSDMIMDWEIRKYNPILDYGGWGIRYGRKGKAYNVSGNIGLQLIFQNGKKLLIGTNKKDQLKWAMEKLMDIKLKG